jgi:hypothetical protein
MKDYSFVFDLSGITSGPSNSEVLAWDRHINMAGFNRLVES